MGAACITIDVGGSVTINSGAPFTNSQSVTLTVWASDSAGVTQMQFSNDGITWSPLQAYATSAGWAVSPGDGVKTVYAQFLDTAGNVWGPYLSAITLDQTPPEGSVLINNGAAYTSGASVTLNVSATDNLSGVAGMCFSNDGSVFSAWQPYSTSANWALTGAAGVNVVYAQFMDGAGNVSTAACNAGIAVGTPLTVSQAKDETPDGFAILGGVVVTAIFDDCIYVEAPDRSAGIKVTGCPDNNLWDQIDLSGAMLVSAGEKALQCSAWSWDGSGPLGSLGMHNRGFGAPAGTTFPRPMPASRESTGARDSATSGCW